MAVYVDNYRAPFRNMIMCHMMADTIEELHAMAKNIGLRRAWFQNKRSGCHYDIAQTTKGKALICGAVEIECGTAKWLDIVKRARTQYAEPQIQPKETGNEDDQR